MADENDKPKTVNYSSNSKSKKDSEQPREDRPEVKKVVSGEVVQKKQSLGSKFKETFAGDDASSVGSYLLFDVIIPQTKNLLSDMVSQGIDRLLFGTSSSRPRRSGNGGSQLVNRTSYSTFSKPGGRTVEGNGRREMSQQSRANHDFSDIILESRGDAEVAIETINMIFESYDVATVADLYAAVGITSDWTDQNFGWVAEEWAEAGVRHVRAGYLLDVPKPRKID